MEVKVFKNIGTARIDGVDYIRMDIHNKMSKEVEDRFIKLRDRIEILELGKGIKT